VTIETTQLPAGEVNQFYLVQLQAANGQPPYTWGFVTTAPGTLPPGLTLNNAAGVISGTPTVEGMSTFTIQVTDSDSPPTTASREFSIVIDP
jgi:hypothetical protein